MLTDATHQSKNQTPNRRGDQSADQERADARRAATVYLNAEWRSFMAAPWLPLLRDIRVAEYRAAARATERRRTQAHSAAMLRQAYDGATPDVRAAMVRTLKEQYRSYRARLQAAGMTGRTARRLAENRAASVATKGQS